MATLVLPLTQRNSYSWTYFNVPSGYSRADPIEAQHIYSVSVQLTFCFDIERYNASWHDDQYNYYTYIGPGNEPRDEIQTFWNFIFSAQDPVEHHGVIIVEDIKQLWIATKEEFTNKQLYKTVYFEIPLTSSEEETLIEWINSISDIHVAGYYEDEGAAIIPGGTFMIHSSEAAHYYRAEYINCPIRLSSESYLTINYLPVGSIAAPTGAYAPANAPVQNVPLLWQEPQKTENETWDVEITHYAIWRCDTVDGEYTKVGETDGPVLNYSDTTATPGTTWYYKIQACSEEIPLYNSELSAPTAGTYVNHAPGAIAIETGQGGTSYNPRPRILATLGADADNVMLQLAAEGYTASRVSAAPGERVAFIRTTAMETAGTESVTITEADPAGNVVSADADAIYTVPAWTDVPVIAGTTIVKAVHINELRAQLEELCEYYGMDAPEWSEDVTAGTTPSVRFTTHATELQNVVRAIATKINSWDTKSSRCNVALPSLIEPQRPLASVINQLRDIIKIL